MSWGVGVELCLPPVALSIRKLSQAFVVATEFRAYGSRAQSVFRR